VSWEKIVYRASKVVDNWVTGDDAKEIRTIFESLNRHFGNNENYAVWKEDGYEYITWGGNMYSNIRDFTCYRRRRKIRWFKKESA
jgi:hypothetical protein